jgi:hypothetical protein
MLRWLVMLCLTVATATVLAQSTPRMDLTTRAWNDTVAADRQLGASQAKRNAIAQRFDDQVKAVDRLKTAPRSWRRDRELRDKLAEAHETGEQLEAANTEVTTAQQRLANARAALVTAIDGELAAGPTDGRKKQLQQARAQVVPQKKAHRIVLPDMNIDRLAEPEELDQRAQEMRSSETELQNQVIGLEVQAKELDRIAMLRKASDRAKELDSQDGGSRHNAPRGGTGNGTGGGSGEPALDQEPVHGGGAQTGGDTERFADISVTLADVVDPSTLDALHRAQRSNDPKVRAEATRRAREAVQKKLDQLQRQRKQVEDRAKQLRSGGR